MQLVPTKYYENCIRTEVIEELKNLYYNAENYQTDIMMKTSGKTPQVLELLETITQIDMDRIDTSHFYLHNMPYLPHTDFRNNVKENVVIPIEVINGPNPSLVIFDQWWPEPSNTWVFDWPHKFEINKELKGRPCDYDIENKTDCDIDEELYTEHLNHFPKENWRGLSGKAYKLQPGNLVEFDAKMIHATGTMQCEKKLGLTIRYK